LVKIPILAWAKIPKEETSGGKLLARFEVE
jgi:hypothetical protein